MVKQKEKGVNLEKNGHQHIFYFLLLADFTVEYEIQIHIV